MDIFSFSYLFRQMFFGLQFERNFIPWYLQKMKKSYGRNYKNAQNERHHDRGGFG